MENRVFRQKNIDKINSPESLNDYVKVTNPSVWIILVGTLVIIVGILVFCAGGRSDTKVNAAVLAEDGQITAYVDEADIQAIQADMKVMIDGKEFPIKNIADRPIKKEQVDEYALHKGNLESSQWLFPISLEGNMKDGVYTGSITVDQVLLISYILN